MSDAMFCTFFQRTGESQAVGQLGRVASECAGAVAQEVPGRLCALNSKNNDNGRAGRRDEVW